MAVPRTSAAPDVSISNTGVRDRYKRGEKRGFSDIAHEGASTFHIRLCSRSPIHRSLHPPRRRPGVAEHGWCYLNAIVDCCTREIPGFSLDLRCRRQEAEAVIEAAVIAHGVGPGSLTLGTDG